MCGDEVITILLLPVEAGGETECLKSFLQVCADAVDACFGEGAGVDVDDGFEVVEVFVHMFFCLFYIVVVWHFVPPDVYILKEISFLSDLFDSPPAARKKKEVFCGSPLLHPPDARAPHPVRGRPPSALPLVAYTTPSSLNPSISSSL